MSISPTLANGRPRFSCGSSDEKLRPTTARVVIPALVRGDELVTKSGCYGDILREARPARARGQGARAGVMIGNPFTDVPELCTQALICVEEKNAGTERAIEHAGARLLEPATSHAGQADLAGQGDRAGADHRRPVIFTDAADATSSGATGDSNVILGALIKAKYPKRVLVQIVDAGRRAKAAAAAGIGKKVTVTLGGERDPGRFKPLKITATVESLSSGRTRLVRPCARR